MKVLTLEQPYASIVALGLAQWITSAEKLEYVGELAIHASSSTPDAGRIPRANYGPWADRLGEILELGRVSESKVYASLPLSTVVAVVDVGVGIPTGRYDPPAYDHDLKAFNFDRGRFMCRIENVRAVKVEVKGRPLASFELWDLSKTSATAVRKQLATLSSTNGDGSDAE